jgi:sugar lactone lactonase YvrE
MSAEIASETICELGEGPLWHPERNALIWFDILGNRLLVREAGAERSWVFTEHVSAAGWFDRGRLLVASETGLGAFDLDSEEVMPLAMLESDNPVTRSNDGRADPWGGFWISTMGKRAEPGAGAIYRFHRGTVHRLIAGLTIPNAICFAADGSCAYFADTPDGRILRQRLDGEGWPRGAPETFAASDIAEGKPDGAVIDAEGCLWNARFGAGQVVRLAPDGRVLAHLEVPTPQPTCPAFGGPDLATLFVTTAAEGGLPPPAGRTFALAPGVAGRPELAVVL